MKQPALSKAISCSSGELHYRRIGQGKNLLLALHGFGLSGAMFSSLAEQLDAISFSCIAVDLPGHGQTNWQEPAFSPTTLWPVLQTIIDQENWSSVHLLGFSLGGRVWTKLIASGNCPASVNSLTLIAPDGFKGSYTAWIDGRLGHLLAPVSKLGKHPRPWCWLARQLENKKVISSFSRQFVEEQLGDPDSRTRLQMTLRSLPLFRLSQQDFRALNEWAKRSLTQVWIGQRDHIIQGPKIERILAPLQQIELVQYPGGHFLPFHKLAANFRQLLLRSKA